MPRRPTSPSSIAQPAAASVVGRLVIASVAVATAIGDVRAQDAVEPKYASWSKVESADALREYKERIKESGSFDQVSRTFFVQEVLPQLAREENRGSIERVRRRMREVLLTEIGNPQVLAAANGVVADFMETLARDGGADPVARVNAVVMIGELRAQDGRPWPGSVPRLVGLMKDPKVIMAARIAALSGLSRFGASLAATPETTAAVGQALMGILAEPVVSGRPEQEWLTGRAVGLLPLLVTEYSKPVADELAKMLIDESRSTDVKVRAAAALGARVGAKSAVDVAPVVAAIESLAVRTLADDTEAAERKGFERQYQKFVGGKDAGEGGASLIPDAIARREAWRLITLAGALDGGDGAMAAGAAAAGGKGLAGVAEGPVADKAKALATTLREAALAIDADPTEQSVAAALERLRPTEKKPRPQRQGGEDPAEDGPGEKPSRGSDRQIPANEPAPQPSPFGASPFG